MGYGDWTRDSFTEYSSKKKMSVRNDGSISGDYHAQDMFKQRDRIRIRPNLIRWYCQ